uniref:Uncharacterized protein n=1 Tax=Anguilla anguilla TaxID=7936 RepID=A0A0E9X7M9_ANGAN
MHKDDGPVTSERYHTTLQSVTSPAIFTVRLFVCSADCSLTVVHPLACAAFHVLMQAQIRIAFIATTINTAQVTWTSVSVVTATVRTVPIYRRSPIGHF